MAQGHRLTFGVVAKSVKAARFCGLLTSLEDEDERVREVEDQINQQGQQPVLKPAEVHTQRGGIGIPLMEHRDVAPSDALAAASQTSVEA